MAYVPQIHGRASWLPIGAAVTKERIPSGAQDIHTPRYLGQRMHLRCVADCEEPLCSYLCSTDGQVLTHRTVDDHYELDEKT